MAAIDCFVSLKGLGGTTGRFTNGHWHSKCDLCASDHLLVVVTVAIASIRVAVRIGSVGTETHILAATDALVVV